jgi:hypothetical protein
VTQPVVDYLPTTDALLRNPQLAYTVELPVLGIPTRFETNSRYVRDVAEETFGGWRRLPEVQDNPPPGKKVRVRVVVHEGSEDGSEDPPVRHICPDATRVIVQSPGSIAISDPARRESVAYVTTTLVAHCAFRSAVLEAMTLALLSHFDRHPIHAGAIAGNGRTVLLAGASGSGKSTLAYLAHTAGIDVLSDDRVWVQLTPTFRIWGWPWSVRLLADSPTVFPEIARLGTPSTADGKRKLAIDLGGGTDRRRYVSGEAVVCILDRGERPSLRRLSTAALGDALGRRLTAGFDRFPERHDAVVRALTTAGGWRLTLSRDPRESLPLLRRMLNEEGGDT